MQPVQRTLYQTTYIGIGAPIGTVLLADTSKGVLVRLSAENLPPGPHGFHIHEKPSYLPSVDSSGLLQPAGQAGGHYDPEQTGRHFGPGRFGHRGDLPALTVESDGSVSTWFYIVDMTVAELKNHSFIIHAHGDNYSDSPSPLGSGGSRIACGIIR